MTTTPQAPAAALPTSGEAAKAKSGQIVTLLDL